MAATLGNGTVTFGDATVQSTAWTLTNIKANYPIDRGGGNGGPYGSSNSFTPYATANDNISIGNGSLFYLNNTANYNVSIGRDTLRQVSGGSYNVAVGAYAGSSSGSLTNVSPSYTVAVGYSANGVTGSSYCTILGASTYSSYDSCSVIGYSAVVPTNSNQVQLGSSSTTVYYTAIAARSDIRDKADIRDTVLGLNFINALRPVDYKWDMRDDYNVVPLPTPPNVDATEEELKAFELAMENYRANAIIPTSERVRDGSKKRNRYHHGLIAQDVQKLIEETGIDFGGFQDHKVTGGDDVLTISYPELIGPLIKAVQELTAKVKALEANNVNPL